MSVSPVLRSEWPERGSLSQQGRVPLASCAPVVALTFRAVPLAFPIKDGEGVGGRVRVRNLMRMSGTTDMPGRGEGFSLAPKERSVGRTDPEYLKQYQQNRITEGRAYAIAKLGGKCVRCGSTEDLQFDHIDRSTKVTEITRMFTFARAKLDAELEKCQLLCKPCHLQKTFHEDVVHASQTHGTLTALKYCKPICDTCRTFRREYHQRYLRSRGASSSKVERGSHKSEGAGSIPVSPT